MADVTYDPGTPCQGPEKNIPDTKFKIEAVIVCDQYSDFLRLTLPTNKYLFDRLIVVTAPEDKKTQRCCEHYHVECLPTDSLRSRWKEFRKAEGINEGIAKLKGDGWIAHMDADIYLPPQTRLLLENANLDKTMIYGIDRFLVHGRTEWDAFIDNPLLQQEAGAYIHMNAFPIGTRVMHGFAGGYVPIGFFQMFNPTASGIKTYPAVGTHAGRTDTLFAQQWPRAKRGLIPEIIGYHLESIDAANAANWSGRKTMPFTRESDSA